MKQELESLIFSNKNFIYSIISKYKRYFDEEDLYQVAVIGLINAYKNYKEEKNTKFSSYAYFYIVGEIRKYLRESNVIKIDKNIISLNKKIEEVTSLLSQKLQKEPTNEELAHFLEVPYEEILRAKEATLFVSSLDETIDDKLDLYSKVSVIEKDLNCEILDLKQEMENLDEVDRKLIEERYMYDKSQSEVAKVFNMTQVAVSRKEKQILMRLRNKLK